MTKKLLSLTENLTDTHFRPNPNGKDAKEFGRSLFSLLHLSGLNFSGSGKQSGKIFFSFLHMHFSHYSLLLFLLLSLLSPFFFCLQEHNHILSNVVLVGNFGIILVLVNQTKNSLKNF